MYGPIPSLAEYFPNFPSPIQTHGVDFREIAGEPVVPGNFFGVQPETAHLIKNGDGEPGRGDNQAKSENDPLGNGPSARALCLYRRVVVNWLQLTDPAHRRNFQPLAAAANDGLTGLTGFDRNRLAAAAG